MYMLVSFLHTENCGNYIWHFKSFSFVAFPSLATNLCIPGKIHVLAVDYCIQLPCEKRIGARLHIIDGSVLILQFEIANPNMSLLFSNCMNA